MQSPDEVKPEPLYALVTLDGSYAIVCTRNTHGGIKEILDSTRNINEASVMQRYQWRKWLQYGAVVPVEVSRTVRVIPG